MTDEFKSTLFKYLIGKLPNESGMTEEIFKEINDVTRDKWINILPNSYNDFKYEGIIQVKNSDLIVLYGGYKIYPSDEIRGIITIVDNEFSPITSIYKYSNGTYLRYIQCMKQSNDGTFFAIDCLDFPTDRNASFSTSQKRFIMINNFTQQINGNYNLTLQKSYIFPGDFYNFYCKQMFKDDDSSHYIFLGNYLRIGYGEGFDSIRLIELKVNVGSENEWNKTDDDNGGWMFGSGYVEFKDDDYFCEILMAKNSLSSKDIYMWTKDYSEPQLNYLRVIATVNFFSFVDSYLMNNQSVFLNKDEVYFVLNNQHWGITGKKTAKNIGLYYYNVKNKKFKTIYEHYLGEYDFCNLESIYIAQNNNELYVQFNNNINEGERLADYYLQRLFNYEWSPILIGENQYFAYGQRAFYVSNNFNLLKIVMYPSNPRSATWKLYNIKENYNLSKYNGTPYVNKNGLISDNAEIYSNDSLVFARGLYNKTLNNGTTTSTVEIPNTYLNGIDLTSKNLLSETNLVLVKDENVLQKNEYETLYVNFINSIVIVDKNTSIQVNNTEASSYLNSSINDESSYDKAKLYNSIIITYQDGLTKEIGYDFEDLTDYSANITFGIYTDKLISKADIVSNDKTIIYQTIDLSSLELGKNYSIKQRLEVL